VEIIPNGILQLMEIQRDTKGYVSYFKTDKFSDFIKKLSFNSLGNGMVLDTPCMKKIRAHDQRKRSDRPFRK
jgi:hypothetical protein